MSGQPIAVVTGAGSGIGRATALALSRAGYRVALVGRDAGKLRSTLQAIGESGGRVESADLTDPRSCASLIARIVQQWDAVDVLCNIAGFACLGALAETEDAIWRKTLDTNLSSAFYLTREAWPIFRDRGGGMIVNVSSMSSLDPFAGLGAYAVAKSALNMLTRITASEGRSIGVRAVAVAPGAVETPMLRGLFDRESLPSDQTLTPNDVARLICGLILGKREFDSGEVVTIVPQQD